MLAKPNKWTLVVPNQFRKNRDDYQTEYLFKCICGSLMYIQLRLVKNNKRTQCKNCRNKEAIIPLQIGTKFGKWTVLEECKNDYNRPAYKVKCECNHEAIATSYNLRMGKTTLCNNCRMKNIISK